MDFFKSVFSTDPEPSDPLTISQSESDSTRDRQHQGDDQEEDEEDEEEEEEEEASENPNSPLLSDGGGEGGGAWSFGGLIKTIASKSESVIQTYRRDLEEFSTGLKNETSVFKEVASRAVRDLPGSLEVGASVAQESLESVGQAIDEFGGTVWRGTAVIISHGKDALLSMDSDSNASDTYSSEGNIQAINSTPRRYNRFEAQVLGIQNDPNTFVEEPEDMDDFAKWMSEFKLDEEEDAIEGLLYENGTLEGFFEKFVPEIVDNETFWSRYFYRVHRLKQAEDARAKLVKRAILGEFSSMISNQGLEYCYNEDPKPWQISSITYIIEYPSRRRADLETATRIPALHFPCPNTLLFAWTHIYHPFAGQKQFHRVICDTARDTPPPTPTPQSP